MAESAEEAAEAFVSDDGGYERERWSQAAETAAVASGRGGAGSDRQQGCFGGSWLVVDVSRSAAASAARHIHPCPVAPPPSRHPCPVNPSLQSTLPPSRPPRGGGASCGGSSERRDHHCRLLLYRLRRF